VEIVVTGRHTEVPERFRRHLEEKLAKIPQLAPKVHRVDVELSHEKNPRQSDACERVEITLRAKGPVVRAEACADDVYAALDAVHGKLLERLRRARDRRKVHHGRHNPVSVHDATAPLAVGSLDGARPATPAPPDGVDEGESPVVIRQKVHAAIPMTLDQALYEMELVGHDFYLFMDAATGRPSVVYRRRGWSYGVIGLDPDAVEDTEESVMRVASSG
jgi:ribosomal subunit interface protein